VELWTEVITGQQLDVDGTAQVLDASAWLEKRDRLQECGGPPLAGD
jgi:hypothetical protein